MLGIRVHILVPILVPRTKQPKTSNLTLVSDDQRVVSLGGCSVSTARLLLENKPSPSPAPPSPKASKGRACVYLLHEQIQGEHRRRGSTWFIPSRGQTSSSLGLLARWCQVRVCPLVHIYLYVRNTLRRGKNNKNKQNSKKHGQLGGPRIECSLYFLYNNK